MTEAGMLWGDEVQGLSVEDGEFVTVTADGADHEVFAPLTSLLQRVKRALSLDVVFVSSFAGGRPAHRQAAAEGETDSDWGVLEMAYGERLVTDRAVGGPPLLARRRVESQPVVGQDGREFGTVFCPVHARAAEQSAGPEALASVAKLIAVALSKQAAA